MTITHLPESSAQPWPGVTDYRPPGWSGRMSPMDAAARLAEIEADPTAWTERSVGAERKRLLRLLKVLRQSWVTRPWVWQFAELFVGPPEVDPFWNPYSWIHRLWSDVRLLDGNDGRNGFDLSLWGRKLITVAGAEYERGRTGYVNGPHGDTTGYVSLCTQAADAGHNVAAVIALDGCGWFSGKCAARVKQDGASGEEPEIESVRCDVLSCDVLAIPEGGRMSFEPPPGVKQSSPTKGYALAMWGVSGEMMERLWPAGECQDAVSVTHAGHAWTLLRGRNDAGRVAPVVEL